MRFEVNFFLKIKINHLIEDSRGMDLFSHPRGLRYKCKLYNAFERYAMFNPSSHLYFFEPLTIWCYNHFVLMIFALEVVHGHRYQEAIGLFNENEVLRIVMTGIFIYKAAHLASLVADVFSSTPFSATWPGGSEAEFETVKTRRASKAFHSNFKTCSPSSV